MFKLLEAHYRPTTYVEAGQTNPLRWQVVQPEGDAYRELSGVFKCRDYLNDVVAVRYGAKGSVYGFSLDKAKMDVSGDLHILLTGVDAGFLPNWTRVVSPLVQEAYGCVPTFTEDGSTLLVTIPRVLWATTYNISLLSGSFRWCNCPEDVELTWDELVDLYTPPRYANHLKVNKMQPPPLLGDTWWYVGSKKNSSNNASGTNVALVHNYGYQATILGLAV